MIDIDGSVGEGGGQIARMALVLGLLTGTPFRLHSIRAGREVPGLKMQLLHLVAAMQRLSRAHIRGALKGSTELVFMPGAIDGGSVHVSSQASVSIPLLLEGLVPISLRAPRPTRVTLEGGTDVANSMSMDFYRHVIAPRLGEVALTVERRGFYPRSGGRVQLAIEPQQLRRLEAVAAPLRAITMSVVVSGPDGDAVARAMVKGATEVLSETGLEATSSIEYGVALSPGAVISLVAEFENAQCLGADALLIPGELPEQAGARAATHLREELVSGASVDRHAAPSMILHVALEGGTICLSSRTPHVDAALYVCEQFLGPIFDVRDRIVTVPPRNTR